LWFAQLSFYYIHILEILGVAWLPKQTKRVWVYLSGYAVYLPFCLAVLCSADSSTPHTCRDLAPTRAPAPQILISGRQSPLASLTDGMRKTVWLQVGLEPRACQLTGATLTKTGQDL